MTKFQARKRAQRISTNGPNKERTSVEKREKELRSKLKEQGDANKKNMMLSKKNEKAENEGAFRNSPPKNGKLQNNHEQTGPKSKYKAGNTMKQRKLEEKANKEKESQVLIS
ncbi:Oidioi.mRNA.OKI2018_I69.chr2.g4845.t1.cds [Oikopleura dioica]|uniref:Oidioi.mRNA.OKI2018_I69.chr2.g4845.t1.cds n=1 Tax=Oikopleura dioica TaxID=34765 RepID=A0ABN7SZ12_OIKDI|nr:Oidioi.mRNA.OKI2018_I69.chr2.g4845.t1.cds [Oikopleura dioica]